MTSAALVLSGASAARSLDCRDPRVLRRERVSVLAVRAGTKALRIGSAMPSLRVAISDILGVRAEPQVCRVHATSDCRTDAERACPNRIGPLACIHAKRLARTFLAIDADHSVALHERCSPLPTTARRQPRAVHLRLKPLSGRAVHVAVMSHTSKITS